MKPSLLLLFTGFTGVSLAVEFFARSSSGLQCTRGTLSISCGLADEQGVCAYESQINQIWCCNVGEQNCWGYRQACVGTSSSNSPQLFCERLGSAWCCNKSFEACTNGANQINVCIPVAFINIVANGPLPSTSSSTTTPSSTPSSTPPSTTSPPPTTSPSSTTPTDTSQTPTPSLPNPAVTNGNQSVTTDLTPGQPAPTNTSSGISPGAAAGAGIGGLLGLAAIIMAVFFLGKRYGRKGRQAAGLETPDPLAPPMRPVSPFEGVGGYYTPVSAVESPPPIRAEVDGAGIPRHKLTPYELQS